MINIALIDNKERELIFREASRVSKINESIIEKDFWVCFILEFLFKKSKYKDYLTFKGGTSLSKCYHVINRFSEDIDIILDWTFLEYGENEPWNKRSNTAQEKFDNELNEKTAEFLKGDFITDTKNKLKEIGLESFDIKVDDNDLSGQTVIFVYPAVYGDSYIKPQVKLEIGALASMIPPEEKIIVPYIEEYIDTISNLDFKVRVIKAERTFFEKATILHSEANRDNGYYPLRYSRHYYDLFMLSKSEVYKSALNDIKLLFDVVDFKTKFYRKNTARYEKILGGNIMLIPKEDGLKKFKDDYESMKSMFFGPYPEFDEIIEHLKKVESDINKSILRYLSE